MNFSFKWYDKYLLKDDVNGYGPLGKNFIVHVNIPNEVEEHYNRLKDLVNYDNL